MKLKIKFIIFSIFFTYQTGLIKAQLSAGFQGGINVSSLHGHKDYTESKLRLGLTANLLVDVPLDRVGFISLETGLGISQQGMKHTIITESIASKTTLDVKNKLDYLVMPLLLKENFGNVYTKFGVYGGYLINVKSEWESVEEKSGQSMPMESGTNEEFAENANIYDYGISFGMGFIKQLHSRRIKRRRGRRVIPILQIDFKYNIGLTSIDGVGGTPDMDYKNRVFMIGLTISSVPNK